MNDLRADCATREVGADGCDYRIVGFKEERLVRRSVNDPNAGTIKDITRIGDSRLPFAYDKNVT